MAVEEETPKEGTENKWHKTPKPIREVPISFYDINLLRGLRSVYPINKATRQDGITVLRASCYSEDLGLQEAFPIFSNYGSDLNQKAGEMAIDLPAWYEKFLNGGIYTLYPNNPRINIEELTEAEKRGMFDALIMGMIIPRIGSARKTTTLIFSNTAVANSFNRMGSLGKVRGETSGRGTVTVGDLERLTDRLRRSPAVAFLPAVHKYFPPIVESPILEEVVLEEPTVIAITEENSNGSSHEEIVEEAIVLETVSEELQSPSSRKLTVEEIRAMEMGSYNPLRDPQIAIIEENFRKLFER